LSIQFLNALRAADVSAVRALYADARSNASAPIVDRAGRLTTPIEAALNALQQRLALVSAVGFRKDSPESAAATVSSYLSIIAMLARLGTEALLSHCPLRLAVHFRIFPAIASIIEASANAGFTCIMQRDVHGRTLLHAAAASKAAGLSALLHPSHALHNLPSEHRSSYQLLCATLKLECPVSSATERFTAPPTLPYMNDHLPAHEFDIFFRLSSISAVHLNSRDNSGRTALHVAVTSAYLGAVAALLGGGADVNAQDMHLRTALHIAVSSRLHSITQLLLNHGANTSIRDVDGITALQLAVSNHDSTSISTLVRHGADVALLNPRIQTFWSNASCGVDTDFTSSDLGALPYSRRASTATLGSCSVPSHGSICSAPESEHCDESAAPGGWGCGTSKHKSPPLSLTCPFQVIEAISNFSAAKFFSSYVSLQRPVIIKGLARHSAAARLWTKSAFASRWGPVNVTVSAVPHAHSYGQTSSTMSLAKFLHLHMNCRELTGAYVFDGRILDSVPEIRRQCPPPPLLSHARVVLSQLYIGNSATGSFPHFHGHALNMLVFGRKQWFFFPPNEAHFNVKSIGDWLREDWPAVAARGLAAPETGLAQCTQEAGDAVYVPQYWGHAVVNTAPSIGVAYEFDT
jgi:hypothetical protein